MTVLHYYYWLEEVFGRFLVSALLLIPKHVALNDLEWPIGHFALNSLLCQYIWSSEAALKPDFRRLATLKLVVNVVGEL